jgi:DNA gyrase subunit A
MTSYTKNEVIVLRSVEDELKESYIRYSMSVIISRALPDIRDGLKPSQRRILYAMKLLNLGPQGKHRKCAKICGDTSGDFHPHGEGVIYPTLVRLAQDWVMRYNLINGQGNFGSIDGDPPAAMRYTEARLTPASMQLMDDLDKDTVDFVPNYDETKKEPVVLPSRFPNLLCNGSTGIAVGMATNIPPHNLFEVIAATLMLLENPSSTIEDIYKVLPGPDFPTGGIICGVKGIRQAYLTGKGKIIVRGLADAEEMSAGSDRYRIVITEIPYGVNKSRLIEHLVEAIQEKTITGVSDIRDESDREGLRIVIELKRGETPEIILNQVYKHSEMEVTFGCQLLALDKGLPRTVTIKHMIMAWIEHRIEVIRRRTRFELNQAEMRAHILAGYLKALSALDAVIHLIKSSASKEEAKASLMSEFGLSERQSAAILELRLYQITQLESDKISNEHEALMKKIEEYKEILASEGKVKDIIRLELQEITRTNKSERKTKITMVESDVDVEDLIPDIKVAITVSTDDYIKRMSLDHFRVQKRGGQGIAGFELKKEDDAIKGVWIASMLDFLLIFTTHGRCHWLKVWKIPEAGRKSKGKPLVNFLSDMQEGEKIAAILQVPKFTDNEAILLATKMGVVKKTNLSEFSNPRKRGIIALSIDEGDELIAARRVFPGQEIMLFTRDGMAVRFDEAGVREMGRNARGVRGVHLKNENDRVVGCEAVSGTETLLVVCENGFGKRSLVDEFRKTRRGGVGVRSIITNERNGAVIAGLVVEDSDELLMIASTGQTIRIPLHEVRVMGRNTQGVRLANLKDSILVALQRLKSTDMPIPMIQSEPLPSLCIEQKEPIEAFEESDELEENMEDETPE